MRSLAGWLLGLGVAVSAPLAVAQNNLGDVLDAGGKRLSAEDFKREIVQRALTGVTPLGSELEIVYTSTGLIQGIGANPLDTPGSYRRTNPISGEWKVGDGERICTQMQIAPTTGTATTLAARCQFWFKLGDTYFVSDSDVDRRASILRRAIKPASGVATTPSNLGELLDAGAKKLSVAEFKRDVVQRTIVGPKPTGPGQGDMEMMYAANGSIQGVAQESDRYLWNNVVNGNWTTVDGERVCTTIEVRKLSAASTAFPRTCQSWFKLGDAYFVSDSDTDRRAKVLPRSIKAAPASVAAPKDLGQLLDAGGKKVSATEFRRDIAQRTIVGPRPSGAGIELMYAANGSIQGLAQPSPGYPWNQSVSGDWTSEDAEKVCTTMQTRGGAGHVTAIPRSCEFWFKLGDEYYVSDSDTDRRASILRRSIKPASAAAAAPADLGQLLDAGGKKVSVAEFKRDIVQRPVVGPTSSGTEFEIVYVSNGMVQAVGTVGYAAPFGQRNITWDGEWKPGEFERICVAMRGAPYGAAQVLPTRCEAWFKLGDTYYVADSDSDRRAKVLRRTIKP